MSTQEVDIIKGTDEDRDIIHVELGDWLYNAGIVGLLNILLLDSENNIETDANIEVVEGNLVKINLKAFNNFSTNYLKTASNQYGRLSDLIKAIKEIHRKTANPSSLKDDQKDRIINEFKRKWIQTGLERYELPTEFNEDNFENLKFLLEKIIEKLKKLEKDVETFEKDAKTLLSNLGAWTPQSQRKSGFLHSNNVRTLIAVKNMKSYIATIQNKEFEIEKNIETYGRGKNKRKLKCIRCNHYYAQKKASFNTGIVAFAGLNADNINYLWGFKKDLPLCSICQLVYLCAFAGFTKSTEKTKFFFVNDDSSIENLWKENRLLKHVLENDIHENILVNYFYELLVNELGEKSKYALQNISIMETNLEKEVMPKVLSLHVSRNQAHFIKTYQKQLKWLASKYYKIKNDRTNILHEFLKLILEKKLNFRMVNRLIRYYLQSSEKSKSFVFASYSPSNIQQLVVLTAIYFKTIKQKSINMKNKHIWYIYTLGNDLKSEFQKRDAENKIHSIAYRLLNAVRANDRNTFLNVLLRLYIGYGKEVPKNLVNTLESKEQFQIIGHSYINGLLGDSLNKKDAPVS